MSQRELARRTGVPQSVVGRIETGAVVPRADTLDRLLAGTGEELATRPRLGKGIDRTAIAELLRLTPGQRVQLAVEEARRLSAIPRGSHDRRRVGTR